MSLQTAPTLGRDGYEVGVMYNPYPSGITDMDALFGHLVKGTGEAKAWIDANADGPLFPRSRAFMSVVILGGPRRYVSPEEAALAVVMIGEPSNVGYTLEQAWAKAARHWSSGAPNGAGIFLGEGGGFDGDCNWGMSGELDGFVFGAEGLTQFPALHVARTLVSYLSMCLVVERHAWNNQLAGRNLSVGRKPWLTRDGAYQGQHGVVRRLVPQRGSIPQPLVA